MPSRAYPLLLENAASLRLQCLPMTQALLRPHNRHTTHSKQPSHPPHHYHFPRPLIYRPAHGRQSRPQRRISLPHLYVQITRTSTIRKNGSCPPHHLILRSTIPRQLSLHSPNRRSFAVLAKSSTLISNQTRSLYPRDHHRPIHRRQAETHLRRRTCSRIVRPVHLCLIRRPAGLCHPPASAQSSSRYNLWTAQRDMIQRHCPIMPSLWCQWVQILYHRGCPSEQGRKHLRGHLRDLAGISMCHPRKVSWRHGSSSLCRISFADGAHWTKNFAGLAISFGGRTMHCMHKPIWIAGNWSA